MNKKCTWLEFWAWCHRWLPERRQWWWLVHPCLVSDTATVTTLQAKHHQPTSLTLVSINEAWVCAYILYVCVCWGVNVLWLTLTLLIFKTVWMRQSQPISLVCFVYHLVVIKLMTYDKYDTDSLLFFPSELKVEPFIMKEKTLISVFTFWISI